MRTYVWSLPTRVFHSIFAVYIAIAFATSEFEELLRLHASIGYGIAILLLFRLYWGLFGPKYSRFSDWPMDKKSFKEFILHFGKREYVGHNPAASWVMVSILVVTFLTVLSGVFTYGIQEGRGILSFLNETLFKEMELFEELHESLSSLLLFLIFLHIAGVLVDKIIHPKTETIFSILHGYKNIDAKNTSTDMVQKIVAAIFILSALALPITANFTDTALHKSRYTPIEYKKEHKLFAEECASCHTLYPPFLLPEHSWRKIMANLEDHFGDDASIEEEDRTSIEKYLVKNSAEKSEKEAAFHILKSIKNKDIISITKTPYWLEKHSGIEKREFLSKKVKRASNCKSCHTRIEKGLIEDEDISR